MLLDEFGRYRIDFAWAFGVQCDRNDINSIVIQQVFVLISEVCESVFVCAVETDVFAVRRNDVEVVCIITIDIIVSSSRSSCRLFLCFWGFCAGSNGVWILRWFRLRTNRCWHWHCDAAAHALFLQLEGLLNNSNGCLFSSSDGYGIGGIAMRCGSVQEGHFLSIVSA